MIEDACQLFQNQGSEARWGGEQEIQGGGGKEQGQRKSNWRNFTGKKVQNLAPR